MCKKLQPDKNEALHKKATFIVNKVVNELATDESLYANNEEYTGLSNTNKVTINGEDHEGSTKFCTLFASRLNLAPNSTVNCKADEKTLTTNDGMDWYLPISEFKESEYERIKVDVNGSKGPNCSYNESTCKDPDQFIYKIRKGEKVYKTGTQYYEETNGPSGHTVASATNNIVEEEKTGEKTYSITCSISGPGTVYGTGSNKPNGTYHLVAIPQPGYKGNWFTKNVTVKNADITEGECSVTFTPINLGCREDGGCGEPVVPDTPTPPGDDDDDDDDDDTYCVSATIMGEAPSKCKINGVTPKYEQCGLKKGASYSLTSTSESGYNTSWSSKSGTISGNVSETLECNKDDDEKCYAITVTGDTENCPVTLPAGNCKADKTKYTLGSYEYTVKPKEGYVYEKSADPVSKKVLVTGDSTIEIKDCKISGGLFRLTITDHDDDEYFADGTLIAGDSQAYKGMYTGIGSNGFTDSGYFSSSLTSSKDLSGYEVYIDVKLKPCANMHCDTTYSTVGLSHEGVMLSPIETNLSYRKYKFLVDTYRNNPHFVVHYRSRGGGVLEPSPEETKKYRLTVWASQGTGGTCVNDAGSTFVVDGEGEYSANSNVYFSSSSNCQGYGGRYMLIYWVDETTNQRLHECNKKTTCSIILERDTRVRAEWCWLPDDGTDPYNCLGR